MFIRRFAGTIVEDVAPTVTEIVGDALCWPSGNADIRSLLERLARAPKDRTSDNLLFVAQYGPNLDIARRDLGNQADLLADLPNMLEGRGDIELKALATWLAAGTATFPGANLARTYGRSDDVLRIYLTLGVPERLIEGCRQTLKRMRDPLAIFYPLIWLEAQRANDLEVVDHKLGAPVIVRGIPTYALGGNCRLGKEAVRRWIAGNAPLRRALDGLVHPQGWQKAAEIGMFHAESGLFGRALVWSIGKRLQHEGVVAEFIGIAARPDAAWDFVATAKQQLPQLDEIRADLIEHAARAMQFELPLER